MATTIEAPERFPDEPARPQPRRRWRRGDQGLRGWAKWGPRLLKISIGFLAVSILAAACGLLYVRWRLGQINRIAIEGLDEDTTSVMNVLLVGSDSRANVEGELADATGKGQVSGQRSDTMMILHIDARQQKAAILSIPRDLYVPINGTGSSDRINTAYATGGPSRLVRTIQEGLGIQVNHYVEVDFVGFQSIVDTVGGVRLYVPAPVRDAYSGLDIPKAGCVTLDGDTGLAWVRSRHYQYFEAGKWVEDPTADLGRIQRQQDFIRRMMKKAVSSGLTNPLALNRIIGIGVANVTLDDSMSTKDIVKVARRFRSLDPDTVDMLTLPATGANVGGSSVLRLNQTEAQPYIDRMNGALPPEEGGELNVRPSDVRVRILNGNGGDGVASKTGTALQGVGFNVADRGDADNYKYRRSVIRHAPGQADKSELLRRHLKAGATIQEDRNLRTVDLTLIVGADYAGVTSAAGSASGGGSSTPDTTVPQQSPVPTPKGVPATEPAC